MVSGKWVGSGPLPTSHSPLPNIGDSHGGKNHPFRPCQRPYRASLRQIPALAVACWNDLRADGYQPAEDLCGVRRDYSRLP